jgi:hypothetical protein
MSGEEEFWAVLFEFASSPVVLGAKRVLVHSAANLPVAACDPFCRVAARYAALRVAVRRFVTVW